MSSFYKLNIAEVRRETPEAVSILFNVPLEFKDFYRFTAGQYINLKLTLDGEEIRRAYSLCSAPESSDLRIAVKAVKNGTFSPFANSQLKAGATLEVGTPEGKFTFEPDAARQKNYIAFAAGSGITPVLSIIQSVLISEPKSSFVLVYGNKTPESTIFHQPLCPNIGWPSDRLNPSASVPAGDFRFGPSWCAMGLPESFSITNRVFELWLRTLPFPIFFFMLVYF